MHAMPVTDPAEGAQSPIDDAAASPQMLLGLPIPSGSLGAVAAFLLPSLQLGGPQDRARLLSALQSNAAQVQLLPSTVTALTTLASNGERPQPCSIQFS